MSERDNYDPSKRCERCQTEMLVVEVERGDTRCRDCQSDDKRDPVLAAERQRATEAEGHARLLAAQHLAMHEREDAAITSAQYAVEQRDAAIAERNAARLESWVYAGRAWDAEARAKRHVNALKAAVWSMYCRVGDADVHFDGVAKEASEACRAREVWYEREKARADAAEERAKQAEATAKQREKDWHDQREVLRDTEHERDQALDYFAKQRDRAEEAEAKLQRAEAAVEAMRNAAERVVCTAEEIVGEDDSGPVVVGYRHKTGAMHALIGVLRGALPLPTPQSAPCVSFDHELTFTYTNYRGETSTRRVRPTRIRFAPSEWHPEPQWLLDGYDLDKKAERSFAVRDMVFTPQSAPSPERHPLPDLLAEVSALLDEHYPAHIFVGGPGADVGVNLVADLRRKLASYVAELPEKAPASEPPTPCGGCGEATDSVCRSCEAPCCQFCDVQGFCTSCARKRDATKPEAGEERGNG